MLTIDILSWRQCRSKKLVPTPLTKCWSRTTDTKSTIYLAQSDCSANWYNLGKIFHQMELLSPYWTECLFEIDMIRGPFRENLVQSVWENGTESCGHFQAITVRVVCMYVLCFQKRFSNYLFVEKETCEIPTRSCDSNWVGATAFKINLVSYS